jgi:alpha-L-rhamnosidase
MASIKWEKKGEIFITDIEVPVGSTALIHIPSKDSDSVKESGKKIKASSLIKLKGFRDGYAVYTLGSGRYHFESTM